jgi:hypothetical protein
MDARSSAKSKPGNFEDKFDQNEFDTTIVSVISEPSNTLTDVRRDGSVVSTETDDDTRPLFDDDMDVKGCGFANKSR